MPNDLATARVDMTGLRSQVTRLATKSSRTIPQVLNQTSLNAIGRATNYTRQADKQKIKNELGQFVKVDKINKQGKIVRRNGRIVQTTAVFQRDFYKQGPRIALIINARRRKAGLPGLEGAEMERAVAKVLRVRIFSSGFEKSGWFPGMRALINAIKSSGKRPFIIANMTGIAAVGQPKGEATPAKTNTFTPTATVRNSAKHITDVDAGALQRGINDEEREIKRHLEEDMKQDVDQFNRDSKR